MYQQKIRAARQQGYTVTLLYFWLSSPALAQERVLTRVAEGGHSIAPDVIERRYWQGLRLLFDVYLPLVEEAMLFDNSSGSPILLARKLVTGLHIVNEPLYQHLRRRYETGNAA